jgi:antitoxin Phd
MSWQVQEAKQRFSELIRAAHADGPQIVSRHGEEVAVVIDIADYHRLQGRTTDFKDYLRAGQPFEDLDLSRSTEHPRSIDLVNEA